MTVRIIRDRIHFGDFLSVSFMRTLRIPDDGRRYPLPPGLGSFPLRRVADHAQRVPDEWREHGGVFLPMFQREAMWLSFSGGPSALKVGVGKVCAVSGKPWAEGLRGAPQDYVVTPDQPWLDGIATGRGTIRQFVAMPLGLGYTVEGQVTGEERHGGIQLQAFPAKPGRVRLPQHLEVHDCCCMESASAPAPRGASRKRRSGAMGLAAGGQMRQKIYPDPHGVDVWDLSARHRVFVHLVNSELWQEITGEAPPETPVTARAYSDAGLPWYDLYDEGAAALGPSSTLAGVRSVKHVDAAKATIPQQDDGPVDVGLVESIQHWYGEGAPVDDGHW